MKKGILVSVFILIFCIIHATAQDTLYVKKQDPVVVKITEIGLDEIKYIPWGVIDPPVIVVLKRDVTKVVMSNGQVVVFTPDPLDLAPTHEVLDKTHCIKIDFLSPLTNDLVFGYEQVIKPGFNIEGKIGLIGIGVSNSSDKNLSGIFIKTGPKFFSGGDYTIRGAKMSHPLRGKYIRPEFIFSRFSYTHEYSTGWQVYQNFSDRITSTNVALNIVFGKQYLLANIMTLDMYFGIGYGWQWNEGHDNNNLYQDYNDDFELYAYSHMYSGKNFPLAISAGLMLGVIF